MEYTTADRILGAIVSVSERERERRKEGVHKNK